MPGYYVSEIQDVSIRTGFKFRVQSFEFRVSSFGFRVPGLEFRVVGQTFLSVPLFKSFEFSEFSG